MFVLEILATAGDILRTRSVRYAFAWMVLLGMVIARVGTAWVGFDNADRADGNRGHTTIDFGGQWLLGRVLVTGHPRELYARATHLRIARESYPIADEAPEQTGHDADNLISYYMGNDDDPIGGPLYPPIHAFVMAPFAQIDDPHTAYRVTQIFMLACTFLGGLGITYLTRGRWWWPVATAILIAWPGTRGGIDLGQNAALSTMLLIWGWAFVVRGRPILGGVVFGLLAFKPIWSVSFLTALVLLRQYRTAFTMSATAGVWILATLPLTGMQVWFDWLHVARQGASLYNVDENWVFLSRDLFGIPRRFLLDFDIPGSQRDRPIAAWAGWILWGITFGLCLITVVRRTRSRPLNGWVPGLVFLTAWLCGYRYMYYDAQLSIVGVVILLADPRGLFRPHATNLGPWRSMDEYPRNGATTPTGGRILTLTNSFPLTIIVGLLLVENSLSHFDYRLSLINGQREVTQTAKDGSTSTRPTAVTFSTDNNYPWDTVLVWMLWLWCVVRINTGSADVTETPGGPPRTGPPGVS